MRTKMTPGINKNFSPQHGENIFCELCKVHVDCQEHLLRCVELSNHVAIPSDVEYSDIFNCYGLEKFSHMSDYSVIQLQLADAPSLL